MSIVIDTADYKVEYEKALLDDALSLSTTKTKSVLLIFSSLLVITCVYGLKLQSIPSINIQAPEDSPYVLEGMLSLSVIYLLFKFITGFVQDYLRWRLMKGKANVAHSGKVLKTVARKFQDIEERFNSLAPHIEEEFRLNIESLLKEINGGASEASKIRRWHNGLNAIHYLRFWFLDLSVPVIVSIAGIWLSGRVVFSLLSDIWSVL